MSDYFVNSDWMVVKKRKWMKMKKASVVFGRKYMRESREKHTSNLETLKLIIPYLLERVNRVERGDGRDSRETRRERAEVMTSCAYEEIR
jgi:hypothetical protein